MLNALINALFPHYCAFCGLPSQRSVAICQSCEEDLPHNRHACHQCAIPLASATFEPGALALCGTCQAQPPAYDAVVAPWIYGEYFAYLIQRWKFQGEQSLTPLLFELWQRGSQPCIEADVIAPVPLHWRRRWQRGFNQAELFAALIHARCCTGTNTRLDTSLLRRTRATKAQSAISATARQHNLSGAFTVTRRCDNLRIALVDDVMTTGATAAAITRELKKAGATHVQVLCLARTPSPGR